jgi:hypothetical protein
MGRIASIMRGKTGSALRRSHVSDKAGLSRYIRHSRTEYFVMRRYRLIGAMTKCGEAVW